MSVVLEATGLAADIPGRPPRRIFDGVDLRVAEGESVAIVGRSGSGKSTLLSILGLLQPPEAGRLRLGGQDTAGWSDRQRAAARHATLGFVFQDYALVPTLDVAANVAMPLDYGPRMTRRDRATRVREVLELVGMNGTEKSMPSRLSGGEQQRVALARALVARPPILLADEPTGALDIRTGDEIVRLLRDATAGTGSCLVVVTHDTLVAEAMDRVVHLDATGLHSATPERS